MKGVSDWLLTELRVHLRGSYGPTSELRSFASHAISCQLRFSIATCDGGSGLGAKIQTLLDERSGSTLLSLPMTPGDKKSLDTLIRYPEFFLSVLVLFQIRVLGIVVAGFIHLNRESMLR